MIIKQFTILLLLTAMIATSHIDFVIHMPAVAPLYMKVDKITTFSGGKLTLSNGVYILSYP